MRNKKFLKIIAGLNIMDSNSLVSLILNKHCLNIEDLTGPQCEKLTQLEDNFRLESISFYSIEFEKVKSNNFMPALIVFLSKFKNLREIKFINSTLRDLNEKLITDLLLQHNETLQHIVFSKSIDDLSEKQLKALCLSLEKNNKLKTFILNSYMRDISSEYWGVVSESLLKLLELKSFKLTVNNANIMNFKGFAKICHYLASSSLESISMHCNIGYDINEVSMFDKNWKLLCDSFGKIFNLKVLRLAGNKLNNLRTSHWRVLKNSLNVKKDYNIKLFDVHDNEMYPDDINVWHAYCDLLYTHRQFYKYIKITNKYKAQHLVKLGDFLSKPDVDLKKISFFVSTIQQGAVSGLISILDRCMGFRKISLQHVNYLLSHLEFSQLCSAIEKNKSLTNLSLSLCLESNSCDSVISVVKSNKFIRDLVFSRDAKALLTRRKKDFCDFFTELNQLQDIDFGMMNIPYKRQAALFKNLSKLHNIRSIKGISNFEERIFKENFKGLDKPLFVCADGFFSESVKLNMFVLKMWNKLVVNWLSHNGVPLDVIRFISLYLSQGFDRKIILDDLDSLSHSSKLDNRPPVASIIIRTNPLLFSIFDTKKVSNEKNPSLAHTYLKPVI